MGEAERGESAPRLRISFWCSNGHETQPSFAHDAQVPDTWDCPRCGFPAGQDKDSPRACLTIPVCLTTPCTHSRRTGPRPEYVQYEGLEAARREHAPDAARPPYGRRREWSDRP